MVTRIERSEFLKRLPLFSDFAPDELRDLIEYLKTL